MAYGCQTLGRDKLASAATAPEMGLPQEVEMILYTAGSRCEVEIGRPESEGVGLNINSTQDSWIGEDQRNE